MKLNVICLSALFALTLAACSASNQEYAAHKPAPEQGSQGITDGVIKVTAFLPVSTAASGAMQILARIDNPVTIINPSNVTFTLDGSSVVTPPITNALLDFGKLKIGDLFDNDLKICGTNGKKKCSKAFIQMYTTGTPGAGVWNADGGYGMPIYANLTGVARKVVGLERANAAVVHEISIPPNKHVLRLSDFIPAAAFEMRADFTEAGAGTYATTFVIEYGLAE